MSRARQEKWRAQGVELITGVCPHDCPDSCSWQVAVENGRALDLFGHPDHPITQGSLCVKVDRYLERTYHGGRLKQPLKRVGKKGAGAFRPISWSEAMDIARARLEPAIAAHGPETVLPYSYAGTMGLLQGEGMARRFLNRLGATELAHTICSEAGYEGFGYVTGDVTGIDAPDFAHARLILIWGSNPLTSNLHLFRFIHDAQRAGAEVVTIDPINTRTARASNEWIPIRPGTDGALALAMMHVIVREGLYDREYVEKHAQGFPELAERVAEWPEERAAHITGVPTATIARLARRYATTRPAAIRVNYGLQRHAGGGAATRAITCLPALVGAWRDRGGGILLSSSGTFKFDFEPLRMPALFRGKSRRTINMNRLGDALALDRAALARAHYRPRPVDRAPRSEDAGPPIHALIVWNANPLAVAPDQEAIRRGLEREDLFTVVLEHFQTDTADYADLLLPATTELEHWDILKPYGHLYLALNRPAIAPVGESQPNSEIFRRLARALGFSDSCFDESDEAILEAFMDAQSHPTLDGISWQRLLDQGFVRLNVPDPYLPFRDGGFATPSGKAEFSSERARADGYDALPSFVPPRSFSLGGSDDADHADGVGLLQCISPPAHTFLNSSFVNIERLQRKEGVPRLEIHPDDASARGVVDGTDVEVENEQGTVVLRADVTERVMRGTVAAPGVWWNKLSPGGRNINVLTPQQEADMGGGALFYDIRVAVRPSRSA